MNGFLVVDKPGGMTSRDVVNRLQFTLPRKTKLGHAGTLDPLATGVLVICIGSATRLTDRVQAMGKTYHTRIRLGARSTTDDADGDITAVEEATFPTREVIESTLPRFVGAISQVPPAFSAIKVAGRRAYDMAREGDAPDLAARMVRIDEIRLLGYEPPFLDLEIDCGKGTYIRSLARDLGEVLGCAGLVQTLRRTRIGQFRVEAGVGVDVGIETIRDSLHPLATALEEIPLACLNAEQVRLVRFGQRVPIECGPGQESGPFAVLDEQGELVAVGTISDTDGIRFIPETVFH